jgi:hypothetical protein
MSSRHVFEINLILIYKYAQGMKNTAEPINPQQGRKEKKKKRRRKKLVERNFLADRKFNVEPD